MADNDAYQEGGERWYRRMAEAYRAARRAMKQRGPWDNDPDYLDMRAATADRLADQAKAGGLP